MTGTECFRAALNLLSETPDSGTYFRAEQPFDAPPRMTALTEEIPAGDWLTRECFPYGLAALLVADDDKAKFNWAATEYTDRLLRDCPAQFTGIQEMV